MTPRAHSAVRAAVVATAFAAATAGAEAQPNPVLPFWAQPFPTGFTREEAGFESLREPCRVWRRLATRHGFRTVVEDRCRPVLHARD